MSARLEGAAMIRLGSLYSGIAGLELGVLAAFVEAGIQARIARQCEIDPFATRVLAHHFPDVQRFSDVATVHTISLLGTKPHARQTRNASSGIAETRHNNRIASSARGGSGKAQSDSTSRHP
jgi:site-specific DNA-cytosine methylase